MSNLVNVAVRLNLVQPMNQTTMTNRNNNKKQVKIAEIDVDLIRGIVRDYAGAEAMKMAYSETFKSAGLFLRITSLGSVTGLKDYNVDMKIYARHKEEVIAVCKNKINDIFSNGKASITILNNYLNQLRQRSAKLKREMQQLKDEVLRHNATQADVAETWKRGYVLTKFAADTTITVASNFTGPAGSGISYLYGLSTEVATVMARPDEADVWSFKGSLMAPKLMAWDHAAEGVFSGKMKFMTKTSSIAGIFLSGKDAVNNW